MRETTGTEDGGGNTNVVEPNRSAVSRKRRHGDGAKTDLSRWSSMKLQVLAAAEYREETRERGINTISRNLDRRSLKHG